MEIGKPQIHSDKLIGAFIKIKSTVSNELYSFVDLRPSAISKFKVNFLQNLTKIAR